MTTEEEDEWRTLGRSRFEAAYAPEDAVYDHLMDDRSEAWTRNDLP